MPALKQLACENLEVIFINEDGQLDQRVLGEPEYWDMSDPRPWGAYYAIGE